MLVERKSFSFKEKTSQFEALQNEIVFEDIPIQWDKRQWEFENQNGKKKIDTYSLWNPAHWDEISDRLVQGEICGMYIMGNFGTGEIREAPEWKQEKKDVDVLFEKVKKRSKDQNFVAFTDPEDIIKFIDIDRLSQEFKDFRWAQNRLRSYAGPQHNIFPVKNNGMVDAGLIRKDDNSIACFWIPGHWGYEALSNRLKKKTKHGIFGGGSLNVHGREPSYTTDELKKEFANQPDWQENIDFILFDELAEYEQIGRSQTMVSFTGNTPKLVRIGSLSPQEISKKTGFEIHYTPDGINSGAIRKASSLTLYDEYHNMQSDEKVSNVMQRIGRYKAWYKSNF